MAACAGAPQPSDSRYAPDLNLNIHSVTKEVSFIEMILKLLHKFYISDYNFYFVKLAKWLVEPLKFFVY